MQPLIREKLDDIAAICRDLRVRQLWVFGSAVDGRGHRLGPGSDVDFLVEFVEPFKVGLGFRQPFWQLMMRLEDLLGRRVDLLEEPSLRNPILRAKIMATRQIIYDAGSNQAAAGYSQRVEEDAIANRQSIRLT